MGPISGFGFGARSRVCLQGGPWAKAGDWLTEVRGRRRTAAIRKNVRRHARDRLPLLHTPGSALGPAPLGLGSAPLPLGLAGGATAAGLRFLHGKVGRRSLAGLATLAGGNLQN